MDAARSSRPTAGTYDIAIAGAGPAGALTAQLLAAAGLRVALVERLIVSAHRPIELLSPSADALLRGLLPVERMVQGGVLQPAFGIRRSWGSSGVMSDDFIFHPGSQGWLVNRRRFDATLRTAACAAGAVMFDDCQVASVSRAGERWEVLLRHEQSETSIALSARTIVDATGRRAALARRLGARPLWTDKLAAVMQPGQHDVTGWLHVQAHPEGWSYIPGVGQQVTVGCGPVDAQGAAFAASSTCLSEAAGAGWVAVGDAACAFDPIASQGLSQALASAGAVARMLQPDGTCDHGQARDYTHAVQATWFLSEAQRHEVYSAEGRWPETAFWRGRVRAARTFATLADRRGFRRPDIGW